jgi:AcrR family transcriptional regulator
MSTGELPEARMRALGQVSGAAGPSARERILGEAFALFYAEGIRAVGVDLLIARSGVAKATFYRHFASKNDLVVAYLERRRAVLLGWLAEEVAARATRPEDQLLAVFDALGALFADPEFRGCPVHNTVVEAGTGSAAVRESALAHQAALERYVAELAAAAGLPAPADVAARWVLLVDGAFVGAHRNAGPEAAAVARTVAEHFLSEAVAAAR